jgi:hypothetical protein
MASAQAEGGNILPLAVVYAGMNTHSIPDAVEARCGGRVERFNRRRELAA